MAYKKMGGKFYSIPDSGIISAENEISEEEYNQGTANIASNTLDVGSSEPEPKKASFPNPYPTAQVTEEEISQPKPAPAPPVVPKPESVESNVSKATTPKPKEDQQDSSDLEGNINSIIESGGGVEEIDDRISAGTNYKDAMEELDKELAVEEARLSEGLKQSTDRARVVDLITSGIQAMAAFGAAKAGIKTKLSGPLDVGSKENLRAMQEEIRNRQGILRRRISAKKNLIDKLYSHEVSSEGKAERKAASEKSNRDRIDFYNEQVQAQNLNNEGNYDRAVRKTEQVFLERWKKAPEDVKRQRLREWSPDLTEDQIDNIVSDIKDPDGILFWESMPDYSAVKASIAEEALRIVRKPTPRLQKEGGTPIPEQLGGQPQQAQPSKPEIKPGWNRKQHKGNRTRFTYPDGSQLIVDGIH